MSKRTTEMVSSITVFYVMLSVLSLSFNVGVIAYVHGSKPFHTEISQSRPTTRTAVQALIWMVYAFTIGGALYAALTVIRGLYGLPLLEAHEYWVIAWSGVILHSIVFGLLLLPTFFLMVLTWGLSKTDEISAVQLRAKRDIAARRG